MLFPWGPFVPPNPIPIVQGFYITLISLNYPEIALIGGAGGGGGGSPKA